MKNYKVMALALTGTILLMASGSQAHAAAYDSVIDTSRTGSITLTKLVGVDGSYNNDPTNLATDEYDDRAPVDNIVFSYKKIADIVSVAGNEALSSGAIVGTYYTNLDAGIFGSEGVAREVLGSAPDMTGITLNGVKYYTVTDIETVITGINNAAGGTPGEVSLNKYLKEEGTAMTATDENGTTVKSGLPLGLYLIGETDISAHDGLKADGSPYDIDDGGHNPEELLTRSGVRTGQVIDTLASPYLCSLPFTNVSVIEDGSASYEAGTVWMYDLHTYPKNEVGNVVKRIIAGGDANSAVADGALVTRNDYYIGSTIRQVIKADCPRLYQGSTDPLHPTVNAKKHERYIISDKMSDSLTLKPDSIEVKVGDQASAMETNTSEFASFTSLVKNTDYKVYTKDKFEAWAEKPNEFAGAYATAWTMEEKNAVTDATFFIQMTDKGLDKLNALSKDSSVCVFFDCILNKKASIGVTEGNVNHPALAFKNTSGVMRRIEGNHVYDYTYQLNLKKQGVTDFTQVRFSVTGINSAGEATSLIPFVKEADGIYHVFDNDTDASSAKVTELSPSNTAGAKKGILTIKGLDSESYVIKELSTQDHRSLLKSVFTVTFASNGSADTTNSAAVDVFVENTGLAGRYCLMTGALGTATAAVDGKTANLDIDEANAGIAKLELYNYPTSQLATGGPGRTLIYLSGSFGAIVVLILAAGGGLLKRRRKLW